MLSEEALKEFKELYKEEYGEDIDDAKATDLAINLLILFDCIYRPVKKEWMDKMIAKEKIENKNPSHD